ncbi:hypothetical protein EV127DRAFT_514460 [Xylaria flabelliformis]|nr:hypothetical protein EV127DRAFT_514460 [Xylaria flabelliformis]
MECTRTTGFDFVPYFAHPLFDPLNLGFNIHSSPPSICCFPPSANKSLNQTPDRVTFQYRDFPLSDSEKQRLMEFEAIMRPIKSYNPDCSDDKEELALWIKKCRALDISLDINRIARYAVYCNRISCLRHLVDHEQANLAQKDTFDRSAVFYSMVTFSIDNELDNDFSICIPMLKYIDEIISSQNKDTSKMGELLGQADTNHWIPLQYAVHQVNTWGLEFALAKNSNPAIMNRRVDESIKSVIRDPRSSWDEIDLIFELNKLLPILSSYYLAIIVRQNSMLMQLSDAIKGGWPSSPWSPWSYIKPNEYNMARLHLPCLNGILRRYVREFDCPRYAEQAFGRWFPESSPTTDFDRVIREPSYLSNFEKESDEKNRRYSIVFPCLALRTKKNMKEARRKIKELRVTITQHKLCKKLVQSERTIDETYFPSLSAKTLDHRNENQVVSRETKKVTHSGSADEDQVPMLMVPQLWIWRFDQLVLSAYSSVDPGHLTEEELQHLKRDSFTDTDVMVGCIIADHISQFGEPQINGKFPCPLDVFETSILDVLSEVEAYANPSVESQLVIAKEQGFLFEIADIQEELAMIQDILNQQLIIMDKFIRDVEHPSPRFLSALEQEEPFGIYKLPSENEKWEDVKLSRTKIETYQKRVNKLNADAARIEKRIQDQLNLKRTYASIKEARSARVLSAAVIGFTVVTIIFAPLSFMTSLFALPLDSLQRNQLSGTNLANNSEDTVVYSTRYVGTWFAVAEIVSLAVTGPIVGLSLWLFSDTDAAGQRQGKPSRSKMNGRGSERKGEQELSDRKDDNGSRSEKMSLRKTAIIFLRRLIDSLDRDGNVEDRVEVLESQPLPRNPADE